MFYDLKYLRSIVAKHVSAVLLEDQSHDLGLNCLLSPLVSFLLHGLCLVP